MLSFSDDENNSDSGSKNAPLREQDRFLPIANIAKIMKRAIPENGKVSCSVVYFRYLIRIQIDYKLGIA